MSVSRIKFEFSTDTGTETLTSGPFSGELRQIHWAPTTGDTGADLAIYLDVNQSDTGEGITILDDNDCLGSNKTWVPLQNSHDSSGAADNSDTGTPINPMPFVSGGDRLRARVTPGGSAVAGALYVWTDSLN